MVIDVATLSARGIYEGGFSFDYDPPADLVNVPSFSFNGPVRVDGTYEMFDDDSMDVHIRVRFRLVGSCSYCAEHAEKDIDFSYDAQFVTGESDDDYPYDGRRADIDRAVDDAILFSQPSVILCSEGCKGIAGYNLK